MPTRNPSSIRRVAVLAGLMGMVLVPWEGRAQGYWGGYDGGYGRWEGGRGAYYGRSYAPYYAGPPVSYAPPPAYYAEPPAYAQPRRARYGAAVPVIRRPVQHVRAAHRASALCNCLPAAAALRPVVPVAGPQPGPAPTVVPPNQIYPPERFERPPAGDSTGRSPPS